MRIFASALCIIQVCLLTLASVSPQIHAWVFHGINSAEAICANSHTACAELPDNSGGDESESRDTSDKGDGFCPVIVFGQGITLVDNATASLPVEYPLIAWIAIDSGAVFQSGTKGAIRSRAPPLG